MGMIIGFRMVVLEVIVLYNLSVCIVCFMMAIERDVKYRWTLLCMSFMAAVVTFLTVFLV
jgi:hypothetical protein